jgi:hypothetical protein
MSCARVLPIALFVALGCTPPGGGPEPTLDLQCLIGPGKPVPVGPLVFNGTRTPSHVPLTPAEQLAVVGISTEVADAYCTGTLISRDVVLTARHCTAGVRSTRLKALFGPDDQDPLHVAEVIEKIENDELDLALLRLEEAPSRTIDVVPVPVVSRDLTAGDIGITVEQAGFGRTEEGPNRGLFFVAERLYGFEGPASYLIVDGEGQRGVCAGDSGGPSFRINAAGETRTLGALGWGELSCVGRDRYARADTARAFIEAWTGPTPPPARRACDDVERANTCLPDGSVAFGCDDDGMLQVTRCRDDEVCVAGRCLDRVGAPCGGELAFGRCEGTTLRWCAGDTPAARDCAACGEVCAVVNASLGATCIPSGCGNVDEVGTCSDGRATWCFRGRLVERNCAGEGLVCEVVGELGGAACVDTSACGDLDFTGRCVGDVVEWCDDGVRMQRDCARDDEVCAYVSDDVGYYCVADT